ncbi:MAG TPA: AmmeMemoRadiSam system radical SAM enzyme [Bacteroidota bacterium]|nr:AmmeMemoRadiSam system radical SAM enzyme [Bacteroidota bacterium]
MPDSATISLKDILSGHTRPGSLYRRGEGSRVECYACGHRCSVGPGKAGICQVRYNEDGVLFVPWGYVASLQVDPIEKKPFFHALPGSRTLSFGMLGCDYHCAYCQNWITSQTLRDPEALHLPEIASADDIISAARSSRSAVVTSTYNEPLITSEWGVEVFRRAKSEGLMTAYVSNGNGTPEVVEFLRPWIDLYKIDLKGFDDRKYRSLGGVLQRVLDTIVAFHRSGVWVEIVTLIVPGFNDSPAELKEIAQFIRSVSPDIPWHVTAFHADYRMTDRERTPQEVLLRAVEIGYEEGLRFVYAGNLPGQFERYENTYCPFCRTLLIERIGFRVMANRMENGACPKCRSDIPGVWRKRGAAERG